MEQKNNRIYIFFVVIALTFWNPLVFKLLYGSSALGSNKLLWLLFAFVFASGLFFIYLLAKNKLPGKAGNAVLSVAFVAITFSVLYGIDGLLGLVKLKPEKEKPAEGIIFKPGIKVIYKTVEFNCEANMNSLGLRDREINVDKGDRFRILCFGDSWTFGWGVNVEHCWPRKLEEFLKQHGYTTVEVINCGQGGRYTNDYRQYVKKAVPKLKPDLVLVGVLQLDDLAQIYENQYPILDSAVAESKQQVAVSVLAKLKYTAVAFVEYSFKNTLGLLKSKEEQTVFLKTDWKNSVNEVISNFSHLQKLSFYSLNDSVQALFKSGNLNPGLLNYYIDFTERVTIFNNPENPVTRFAAGRMRKDFDEMKQVCYKNNCELVFVNLPMNYFIGHYVARTPGDELNAYYQTNNRIDSIYRQVADWEHIPYVELTDSFETLPDKKAYFFTYDGHPNEKGYGEIARCVGQYLVQNKGLLSPTVPPRLR